jgi:transcription elongation factor Elf1
MVTFPSTAKKIKITFTCDVCDEKTEIKSIDVPENGEIQTTATCPVCYKDFDVKITHNANGGSIEVQDVDVSSISIEVLA